MHTVFTSKLIPLKKASLPDRSIIKNLTKLYYFKCPSNCNSLKNHNKHGLLKIIQVCFLNASNYILLDRNVLEILYA